MGDLTPLGEMGDLTPAPWGHGDLTPLGDIGEMSPLGDMGDLTPRDMGDRLHHRAPLGSRGQALGFTAMLHWDR